jgi:hypothetical protein
MSMHDRTSSRVGAIVNPATGGALLALFVNDHFLRSRFPSPFAGKVSDFAWLFLAVLASAWIVSFLLPTWAGKHEDRAALAGFSIPTILYCLGKTHPEFHAWINATFEHLTSVRSAMLLDPTDLLALAVLIPAWVVWKKPFPHAPLHRRADLTILGLFGVLTLANMAAPDRGISRLRLTENGILAQSSYDCFTSADGGLTWEPNDETSCNGTLGPQESRLSDPLSPDTHWRFLPGGPIELSLDGGASWTVEYQPPHIGQAQQTYYRQTRTGNAVLEQGPFSAAVDPETHNVVFAMGHEGVLVHTAAQEWLWVAVGEYRQTPLATVGAISSLLMGELFVALDAGLLVIGALSLRGTRKWFPIAATAVTALLWAGVVLAFPPALMGASGYASMVQLPPIGLVTVLCVLSAPFALFRLYTRSKKAMREAIFAGAALALLWPIPYVLWALDIVPQYWIATAISLSLGVVAIVVATKVIHLDRPSSAASMS